MKIKNKYIVPTDMLNYARRIKIAMKNLKKHNIGTEFETRFQTQHMLYDRVERRCRDESDNPWIIYDENAKVYLRGKHIETPKDVGGLVAALRRTKGAHLVVLHADQMGHRKLALILEAIYSTVHVSRMLSIKFEACYSMPREAYPEKGMPVINFFCKDDDIANTPTDADWKRIEFLKKGNCNEVFPYPIYTALDYGTILARASRNNIEESFNMKRFPNASIKYHFHNLYKMNLRFIAGEVRDVLELV